MSTPRRSERLSKVLVVTYMCQYLEVEKQIQKATTFVATNKVKYINPEKKIQMISKLIKIVNTNFYLIKHYGREKYDVFLKTLYTKSFEWIAESKKYSITYSCEMEQVFKKFRKKYETSRYSRWEFMRNRFNLDANIMFKIDSYM
jgi:hypothetical protein